MQNQRENRSLENLIKKKEKELIALSYVFLIIYNEKHWIETFEMQNIW